jgi:hypothetical protein
LATKLKALTVGLKRRNYETRERRETGNWEHRVQGGVLSDHWRLFRGLQGEGKRLSGSGVSGKQLGLLVNFGHHPKIEHEEFVNQPFSRVSRIS